MTTVTFVGIGAIGLPIAKRLADDGHRVVGVDPFEAARNRAVTAGIAAVASFTEAPVAEHVVVMVATPEQLATLILEAEEPSNAQKVRGAIWTIMSTVGPASSQAAERALSALGAKVVDAPVTGGVSGALAGSLTIFLSGDDGPAGQVSTVLRNVGRPRIVGTAVGDGQAVKVVNQHLASVHLVAAAEALALAERLGLDPEQVFDLVQNGAAGSWMLSDRGPRMLDRENAPVLSTIGIFVKDASLVAESAASAEAEVPLLEAARDRFLAAQHAGGDRRDDSSVIETYPLATPTLA